MNRYLPILLAVAISGGFGTAAAHANLPPGVDGCNYFSGGQAGIRDDGSNLPYCQSGGNGCYECCVTEQDQSGWLFCTEVGGNVGCSGVTTEFPDWWPDPDPTDHGQPGDNLPSGTEPPADWTDDGGGGDLGGGLGGDGGCGGYCFDGTHPHHYGKLVPKHAAYQP
jgi:hypothetical protein